MLAPGGGKETQEVKGESGAHLPLPTGLPAHPGPEGGHWPPSPQCGGEMESGSGPWENRTEGRGRQMVSEIWGGQLGEVRLCRQSGLREGQGPGQHFENVIEIAKIL